MSFFGQAYDPFVPYGGESPDFEQLRRVANGLAPFTQHAGVTITELDRERAVADVPGEVRLHNHVGTVHAAAQYLGAEFAAAAAFVGSAATHIDRIEWMVVRDSRALFLRPAVGSVRATASVDARIARTIGTLPQRHRFDIDAKAVLRDAAGSVVGKVFFDYTCQTRPAENPSNEVTTR
ncbi:DUF4442 domain-containing protein [Tsukamurella sp. 8F]|uniref:DUF4442 domain-containing protein n=1 Tax=unclassified Tsukamurella TaxID=2633480 RepID=UPI0023BA2512|nr:MULTISPECIES: DUF4442 domain-containing protein [unclassified Tsukamurella]MDF0529497.1 DUF4442 domain-containing protein [Tsukamurella sp. 8J]MDF0585815.1 DUF4442 domain-containing protein [Tsukamurella sp. 8F]